MAGSITDPLLTEERHRSGEAFAGQVLAACSNAHVERGTDYIQRKTLLRKQGKKDPNADAEGASLVSRAVAPWASAFTRLKEELRSATFPAKAGLAAAICSLLTFVPGPLSVLNKNGTWAVVTADVVLETTVGLTLSKGINRTFGTLVAAAMALVVNYVASKCGAYEPYFVVFCVFLGGSLTTMFKFRRPFKDRWNYAVAMSMVTFHILILSTSDYRDKIRMPLIRLVTIVIGFLIASLVNLCVLPEYVGSTIHELVAKNFERAGNVMESCVTAYCEGTVLEQMPQIITGKSDDNIHMAFHEIVAADSEVDKLMKAVAFEPCHGKFFFGYPWEVYGDITHSLRDTLYDVVALDSCLRAEIQAPMHLRRNFEEEFRCIGKECAKVFRLLGQSIRDMRHIHSLEDMERAEEGALLLQHKIAKYSGSLLGETTAEAEQTKTWYSDKISSFEETLEDPSFGLSQDFSDLTTEPHTQQSDTSKSNDAVQSKAKSHLVDGHEKFMQRRESLSRQWDTTVKRISALSLIKFASLLIELVAKAKFVVSVVDELGHKARFEDYDSEGLATVETPKREFQQV